MTNRVAKRAQRKQAGAKPSKPPLSPRRVPADDITIFQDGKEYHPHAGEWVEFVGRPSMGLYYELMDVGKSEESMRQVLKNLHAWNLTDDEGKPYPQPKSIEALLALPDLEFTWVIAHIRASPERELTGNGFTPST